MKVIDRHILNDNFKLNLIDKNLQFNRDEIIDIINRAKTYLVLEKNVKKGDKVLLTFGNYYLPWFVACAELGLIFVISASHKISNYKQLNDRYGTIDYVIMPFDKTDLQEFYETYKDIALDMNLVKEYDDVSKGLESWATPTSILTTAISDKYNLQIKEITPEDHTHEFYYQLMIRNGFIFNFKYDQRCFHSKILHHGTSLGLYFLPAINYCRDHFWCDDTEYYWPKHVIDYNIDHCICFDEMLKAFIARLRKYNFDMSKLKIYTISLHTEETINTLVKDFKAKVYSLYGMTSTCGPVLWQITSPENVDNFNPRAFKEIDQFYQIDISNEKLTIKYGNKCVHTNDRFDKRDDVYYFLG